MTQNNKGTILKQPKYTVEVKYSDEAIEKKLMRFTAIGGESFEISADEMISMLVNQVNTNTLAPIFVEMDKVNVVQVARQIVCTPNKDIKAGEEFRLEYTHPYPLEFAILEESYKIAKINEDVPVFTLTKEFIEDTKKKITPEMGGFIKKFYKGHKQLDLDKVEKKD